MDQDMIQTNDSNVDLNKNLTPKEFRNVMDQISAKKDNIVLELDDMVTLKDLQMEYPSSNKKSYEER